MSSSGGSQEAPWPLLRRDPARQRTIAPRASQDETPRSGPEACRSGAEGALSGPPWLP